MSTPNDAPDYGPLRGLLIPTLTGVAASGLLVSPWALVRPDIAWFVAPLIAFAGAALIGVVVGNPGNEAALLAGTLLPGVLLVLIEPHHGCAASIPVGLIGLILVGEFVLMFLGLVVGIIWGRGLAIRPLRRPVAVVVLAIVDLLVVTLWIALGNAFASGLIC